MSNPKRIRQEQLLEDTVPVVPQIDVAVNDLCERALEDARDQLHPLVQNSELSRLDKRLDFIQALKSGLEQRIAQALAAWQPDVQAVFKYEETPTPSVESWDGSIHLLVKVPRLSDTVKLLGKVLDDALVNSLHQLGLPRFQGCRSVLEVQQITTSELRHGIGYGAMFWAVYTAPVKVWPQERLA